MRASNLQLASIAGACLVAATTAFVHGTWIISDQMRVAPKSTVTVDLTSRR